MFVEESKQPSKGKSCERSDPWDSILECLNSKFNILTRETHDKDIHLSWWTVLG